MGLYDNEETKYNLFNNLQRIEKLKLIDFSFSQKGTLIFAGNPETNGFFYNNTPNEFFEDVPVNKEHVVGII